jgi:hypothetical protein
VLGQFREAVELLEVSAFELIGHDDGRNDRKSDVLPRQKAEHGHVVNLSCNLRRNAKARGEFIEAGANTRVTNNT